MSESAARAQVHAEGGQAFIRLYGDVTTEAEGTLLDAYQKAVDTRPRAVIFDFTNVGYINSGGIAVLISIVMEAMEGGGQVAATGLSDHYLKVFRMVGLSQYMNIEPPS